MAKPMTGPWPKITWVPLNNVSALRVIEECDGSMSVMVKGSYNIYSVRHTQAGTDIELEPRP